MFLLIVSGGISSEALKDKICDRGDSIGIMLQEDALVWPIVDDGKHQ